MSTPRNRKGKEGLWALASDYTMQIQVGSWTGWGRTQLVPGLLHARADGHCSRTAIDHSTFQLKQTGQQCKFPQPVPIPGDRSRKLVTRPTKKGDRRERPGRGWVGGWMHATGQEYCWHRIARVRRRRPARSEGIVIGSHGELSTASFGRRLRVPSTSWVNTHLSGYCSSSLHSCSSSDESFSVYICWSVARVLVCVETTRPRAEHMPADLKESALMSSCIDSWQRSVSEGTRLIPRPMRSHQHYARMAMHHRVAGDAAPRTHGSRSLQVWGKHAL
jgi:hypothetical protein